ncbi:hypothetical protein BJX64DRAFT_271087 [Aspergillus heterothallicus]
MRLYGRTSTQPSSSSNVALKEIRTAIAWLLTIVLCVVIAHQKASTNTTTHIASFKLRSPGRFSSEHYD